MKNTPAILILGAILAAGAGVFVAGAQELDELARFKAENARLKIQNASLQKSLVEANRREKEAAEALVKIKVRLQALGKDLLSDGDERTVEAWQNVTVLVGWATVRRNSYVLRHLMLNSMNLVKFFSRSGTISQS